jgi:tetratricopeptide (TPR) repeat protein
VRARRLNELGAQLRREGDYERAAEQHLAALAIVRELGDRHAEALTLNNLALALVHTGSVSLAVERFEQALVLLRELGDKEHEGQVIANLGFVRRRQGRDEDAEFLLTAALDKLPPESSAYRHVEEQLRHAS